MVDWFPFIAKHLAPYRKPTLLEQNDDKLLQIRPRKLQCTSIYES